MPTLYHYPLDPFSRSVRLALAECGVEVELAEERPWEWRAEFLAINPAGSVPVLLMDDDISICGTEPIVEYLDETGTGLSEGGVFRPFPGDALARAEVRRLVDWFHRKFESEVTGYLVEEKIYRRFAAGGQSPDMEAMRAGQANLRYHMAYLDHLAYGRNWLAGEEMSFADLAAAAHLSSLDYLGEVPWDEFERVKDWYVRIKSRPSFRPLLGDRVPGFMPAVNYADLDF
jgi:glutathione S-transferase